MASREEKTNEILKLLKDDNVKIIILHGDAGVGKTWMAREISDLADKESPSYVTLWVFLNHRDDKESLHDSKRLFVTFENIARQLSVLSTIEEWEDNATIEKEHEESLESLKGKISAKLKDMDRLLLIVDGVPDTENFIIESELIKFMLLNKQTKVLFTTRNEPVKEESCPSKETNEEIESESEEKKKVVEPMKKVIEIKPFSEDEGLALLKTRVTEKVLHNHDFRKDANEIAKKSKGLPAAIAVIAEALNRIGEHDCGVLTLEGAVKEAATCEEANYSANPLLCCGYKMLPRNEALINCCRYTLQFFFMHGGVHYNELIACWIMEGYFGPVDHIEKAYKEGHCVLVELIDRHLLKIQNDNVVVVEGLALTVLDFCRDEYIETSSLGFASVFEGSKWKGFGRITHADGMIKTLCNHVKWDKVSTLLIDGSRLCKEVTDTFFEPMRKLEVLALFNTTIKSLPSNLSVMVELHLLVLRGCDLLENVDHIKELQNLMVLEISGATSLIKIPNDFFDKLLKLRSLKLSAVQIKSLPSSFSELSELRWLNLKGCSSLEELPRLKKLTNLQVLDLSDAIELRKMKDKTLKAHRELRMLDVSQTKLDRLPFLKNLGNLTQLSLRYCECLTRLPSLKSLSKLQLLDLSGSPILKEIQDESFPSMGSLKTLNFSETAVRHLPSNISSLPNLESLNLSDACSFDKIEDNISEPLRCLFNLDLSNTKINNLPSLSNLGNLQILNLSGCSALTEIRDQSFEHLTCLQRLNLSETKIERLPSLSNLINLCHLLLRNCVSLKELPPLESLLKLEELDLCGARSLEKTEAKFLKHMVHLRFLNLSGTELKLPPMSNHTNLTKLSLRGCSLSELYPNLGKYKKLEVLDLSETDIESLPSLDNFINLRDLQLRGCSKLEQLLHLKSLEKLEVLDLWETGVKEFPYEISELTRLKHLDLPDLKDVPSLDWGQIKHLPEELNWAQCHVFEHVRNRPCISVRGTDFFLNFKESPELWETYFKEFQFSVFALKEEGKAGDIWWHKIDPFFRKIYFQTLSFPEEHGQYLEVMGFDSFPAGVEVALLKAEYISLIDNKFIESLSDLAAGVKAMDFGNVMAMKCCRVERSTKMKTIFGGEAEVIVERNLETLWVSNLPVLDSVSSGDLQLGCFKNFRKLYLDCCPMLKTIPSSQLPENLEVLQIKFCDKLETLFMPNTSTEFKLQNLKKVYLVELPNLTSIGVLETSIGVLETESLPDIFPSTKSIKINFRGCPKLAKLDGIKKLPHLNVQVLS